jgi:Na+-driven multidrug efflux pump
MSGSINAVVAGTTSNHRESIISPPRIRKEILVLAIAAVLAITSGPILSLIDTAMIGRLGAEPLAARDRLLSL